MRLDKLDLGHCHDRSFFNRCSDGGVEICFDNGNRKEVSADGSNTKIYYYNGDWKETLKSGLVKYFYSQTKTWHLTYPDGKEVLQFSK